MGSRVQALAVVAIAAIVGGLSLAACGDDDDEASSDGYKALTEDFLNKEVVVEDAVGGEISGASCDQPSNTTVGAQYQCVANVDGLGEVLFDVEIDMPKSFLVTDFSVTTRGDNEQLFLEEFGWCVDNAPGWIGMQGDGTTGMDCSDLNELLVVAAQRGRDPYCAARAIRNHVYVLTSGPADEPPTLTPVEAEVMRC